MPAAQRFLVELHHRKQIALIGQRHRRHARCRHRGHQFRHAHDPVDQRVLGVQPQMNELASRIRPFSREAHRLEGAPVQADRAHAARDRR